MAATVSGMTKLLIGLFGFLALTGTTAYVVEDHASNLIPLGAEVTALQSIEAVARDAQAVAMLERIPIEDALAGVDLRQGAEAVTIEGSRVTWAVDGYCWTAVVPGGFEAVTVEECPVRQP